MQRTDSFSGRFLLLCGSNLALQAMGFLYRVMLSRYAGAEALGIYRLAFSIYIILHAACLSGTAMTGTKLAAAWKANGYENAVSALLQMCFLCAAVILLPLGGGVLLFRRTVCEFALGNAKTAPVIPIMLCCLVLTGIENLFKSVMIGLGHIDRTAMSELTEQCVRILATTAFLLSCKACSPEKTAVLIFCGTAVSETVSAVVMTVFYLHSRSGRSRTPPSEYQREVLRCVVPVTAAAVSTNCIASMGTILLPRCLTLSGMTQREAVAALGMVSGVAAPILILPMALISSLCTVTMPEISARFQRENQSALRVFADRIYRTVGLIGIPFTAILIPLAPAIARQFFYQAVPHHIFVLMGISCICGYYQMITGCLLNGIGRQSWNAVTAIGGEVLQLLCVCALSSVPQLRINGYIAAQCIAPMVVVGVNLTLLSSCGLLERFSLHRMAEPLLCGAVLYLWTRIFFTLYLGLTGQWGAIFLTTASSFALYLVILRMMRVELLHYLTHMRRELTALPMFY